MNCTRPIVLRASLVCLVVFGVSLLACSTGTSETSELPLSPSLQKEAPDDTWYNQPGFRGIFGDFDVDELPLPVTDRERQNALRARGQYLVEGPAACGTCHRPLSAGTEAEVPSTPMSGGRLMTDRFGLVRAANITSNRDSGIGQWTDSDIVRALRSSLDRKGRPLSLELHSGFRWLSDYDALAIALYIQTLPGVDGVVERRVLGGFQRNKWGIVPIHQQFAGYVPVLPETESSGYGRYLVQHVAQCAMCHSRPGASGADELAGYETPKGVPFSKALMSLVALFTPSESEHPDDATADLISPEGRKELGLKSTVEANMTEEAATDDASDAGLTPREIALKDGRFPIGGPNIRGGGGLQAWSVDQVVNYLKTGFVPSGERADGRFCPWPYYRNMTEKDQRAIGLYLKSLS